MPSFSSIAQAATPFSTLAAAASEAVQLDPATIVGIVVAILVAIVVALVLIALIIAGQWKIYKKAGYPGWTAIVPFYNCVIQLRMTNRPLWWVVLLFVPIANIVFFVLMTRRTAGVFGKGTGFTLGLIFLPFIFYPILGFGKASYHNGYPPAKPMSEEVKWALIAALAFVLMQGSFMGGVGESRHHALTPIAGSTYVTDGERVYYNDTIVPQADPNTFTPDGYYAYDWHHVYYEGRLLDTIAAGQSFVISTDGMYGQTQDVVYFNGDPMVGVDAASFEALGNGYAKDARQVYVYGDPLVGADAATFTSQTQSYSRTKAGDYYDAQDAHHYYYYGDVVKPGSNQQLGE